MTALERIICSAIHVETGKAEPPRLSHTYPATGLLFCGWRHGDCLVSLWAWKKGLWWWERRRLRKIAPGNLDGRFSGFLTSTGRFVSRPEAKEIAYAAGQITTTIAETFTSEDLY